MVGLVLARARVEQVHPAKVGPHGFQSWLSLDELPERQSPSITNHFHIQQANIQQGTVHSQQTATLITSNRLEELAAMLRDGIPSLELNQDVRDEIVRAIETIEAEAKKPEAGRDPGPLKTTLGRVTNILVAGDAARELVLAFVEALSAL